MASFEWSWAQRGAALLACLLLVVQPLDARKEHVEGLVGGGNGNQGGSAQRQQCPAAAAPAAAASAAASTGACS